MCKGLGKQQAGRERHGLELENGLHHLAVSVVVFVIRC
jgi:hypothetical protein